MAPRTRSSGGRGAGKRKASDDGDSHDIRAAEVPPAVPTRRSSRRRNDEPTSDGGARSSCKSQSKVNACDDDDAQWPVPGSLESIDVNTGRRRSAPKTPRAGSGSKSSPPADLCVGPVAAAAVGKEEDGASLVLPDNALADVMFSGFLDTVAVVSKLTRVCKRVSRIGHDASKTLDLHNKPVTEKQLATLLQRFHHVEALDLSFCRKLHSSVGAPGPPLQLCVKTLQDLSLRGVGVDDTTLSYVGRLTQLRRLDVSQSQLDASEKVTDAGILALSGLRELTYLSVAWNKNVTDEAVAAAVGSMPRLAFLDASLCQLVGGETTTALVAQCPALEELLVEACPKMDRVCLSPLAAEGQEGCGGRRGGAAKLRSLKLRHCERVTSAALTVLCDVPSLRALDVSHCSLVSEADRQAFQETRPDVDMVAPMEHPW